MKNLGTRLAIAAVLSLVSIVRPAAADPLKNIVLVHGAWVDASGWKPVYEILTKEGFNVTHGAGTRDVVSPTMSLRRSAFSTSRTAPRSWSGIAMAARSSPRPAFIRTSPVWSMSLRTPPMSAKTRRRWARRRQACWRKTEGAIKKTPDEFTYLNPADFPKLFAPDLPRERAEFVARSQVLAAATGVQHAADRGRVEDEAELGHRRRQRPDHQSRSRALVLRARQEPHDRDPGCQPLRLRVPPEGSRGRDRRRRPQRSANDVRPLRDEWPPARGSSRHAVDTRQIRMLHCRMPSRLMTNLAATAGEARDARIRGRRAGSRKGKIVEARDATRLLEAVIRPGDRVCLEGDNQKQADLLSAALLAVDLAKVNDLHMVQSGVVLPEHLDLFDRGVAKKLDYAYSGPQSARIATHAVRRQDRARRGPYLSRAVRPLLHRPDAATSR